MSSRRKPPYMRSGRGQIVFASWFEPSVAELIEIAKSEFPHVTYDRVCVRIMGGQKGVTARIALTPDGRDIKFYNPGSSVPIEAIEERSKWAFPNHVIDDVFMMLDLRQGAGLYEDSEGRFHFYLVVP